MSAQASDLSFIGLTQRQIKAALEHYVQRNAEEDTGDEQPMFYPWEGEALTRIFSRMKDDPDAIALLCHMMQYCVLSHEAANRIRGG